MVARLVACHSAKRATLAFKRNFSRAAESAAIKVVQKIARVRVGRREREARECSRNVRNTPPRRSQPFWSHFAQQQFLQQTTSGAINKKVLVVN